jgi:5,10-methylenetetrahydrofolate reductase
MHADRMLAAAELVRSKVDAVNVTDLQSSVMRLGSLTASFLLKQNGFEPIYQLTCRDRNRLALQSDLLSAAALGIQNVLIATGDHPSLGDHPQAKPVFDLDSVSLLRAAAGLVAGQDMAGKKLDGAPNFFLGAVVSPGAEPVEPQLLKMEKKAQAGAVFFQTQAIFDPDAFARFMETAGPMGKPVFAGIIMLKSAGMARFMNRNVPGVHVPDRLIEVMEAAKDRQEASVGVAVELTRQLRPLCQGIHLMAMGWDHLLPRVLEASGLAAQGVV